MTAAIQNLELNDLRCPQRRFARAVNAYRDFGASDFVLLPDGHPACVYQMLYTHAILWSVDEFGHRDRWCYPDYVSAAGALADWVAHYTPGSEPEGWIRHPTTGRRQFADHCEIIP